MRGPDERIAWALGHKPVGSNRCAEHVMHALDAPVQGLPDATAVMRAVASRAGKTLNRGPAPRGVIHYWSGGSAGHGHVGIALGDAAGNIASVDVAGPGSVGSRPLGWFATAWPQLRYEGWSWWWGGIDTQPIEEVPVAKPYVMLKTSTPQRIPLNEWTRLDLGAKDQIQPPVGDCGWDAYVNLDLGSAPIRNDLRYILGRWARHDASSDDLTSMGGLKVDVTGADTKAIPPDLPKTNWRSTWSHFFKGEAGVPVSFWVYVGSTSAGVVTSPLRIFKINLDD